MKEEGKPQISKKHTNAKELLAFLMNDSTTNGYLDPDPTRSWG